MKLPYLPQDDLALDAARRGETGAGRGRCGLGTDRTSRRTAANGLEPRTRARELCRFPSWCLELLPKTGVVLSLLLDLPRLPARPALWILYHTYKLLKSQSGTLKGCGAPGWTMVPPPVRKLDPKNLEAHAIQCFSVPPFIRKINSKGPPFSMRGVPAQGYSGFGLKFQTPVRKSAQLSRARACGRDDQER